MHLAEKLIRKRLRDGTVKEYRYYYIYRTRRKGGSARSIYVGKPTPIQFVAASLARTSREVKQPFAVVHTSLYPRAPVSMLTPFVLTCKEPEREYPLVHVFRVPEVWLRLTRAKAEVYGVEVPVPPPHVAAATFLASGLSYGELMFRYLVREFFLDGRRVREMAERVSVCRDLREERELVEELKRRQD